MSNPFFKKHIGQDNSEPVRHSPAPQEIRQPEAVSHQPSHSTHPAPLPVSRPTSSTTRNVLSSDVEIKGSVKFSNDLVVDGKIEGEISSDGNLTVGENARLKAEIKTATVIVYGKVHGNITATDRVELKSSAEVVGDIKSKTLCIEAGAIFVGKSTVGTPAQVPATQATATPTAATAAPAAVKAPVADSLQTPKQGTLAGTNS